MIKDILLNFNWVDVLIICLLVRIVFVGAKSNIFVEILGLLGDLCSTFVTLHYYGRFGDWLNKNVFLPEAIQDLFAFILIVLTVKVIFKLILNGWSLVFKVDVQTGPNEWGSAIVAAVRGVIICGLLFVFLMLSGNDYVKQTSRQSFTGFYLTDFSSRVYRLMHEGIVSRFFPDEPINDRVFDLDKSKDHKGKK